MTVRISGTNTTAAPGFQGGDSDTGIRPGTNEIEFVTGGSVAATFNSSGNLVFPDTQGIDFSAASGSAAGSTSAILDDYEEGTFTPSFLNGTFTYGSSLSGLYTKIGNQVTAHFQIPWTAKSGSGTLGVVLPFVSGGDLTNRYCGTFGYVSGVDTMSNRQIVATVTGTGNNFVVYVLGDNASPDASLVENMSSTGELQATITFIV
ncbi:hypothetical protein [Synechococcus phage S-B05]|nr:hypothetical protein [Synechococcus phage S-B05]